MFLMDTIFKTTHPVLAKEKNRTGKGFFLLIGSKLDQGEMSRPWHLDQVHKSHLLWSREGFPVDLFNRVTRKIDHPEYTNLEYRFYDWVADDDIGDEYILLAPESNADALMLLEEE